MTQSPPTGDLVASHLRSACLDWDGKPMADEEEPRIILSCRVLREAAEAITTLERELEEVRDQRVGALAAIADIREVTGLGAGPMLSDLARAVQIQLGKYAHAADTAKAERDALQAEVERLKEALKLCQSVLAMMTAPDAIRSTSVMHAWTHAVEAEATARAALQVEESKG